MIGLFTCTKFHVFSKLLKFTIKNQAARMAANSDKIQAGEWVIIQRENFVKIHKVGVNSVAMLGRDCVELTNLIDQPKWSTYSLEEKGDNKGKKNVRKFTLKKCDSIEFEENVADTLVDEIVDGKDNRFIKDDGTSQKLSKEEIEEMQSEGASAKEIIGQLVENSSTFDQKTAYAKEKYVNKKQKKYKRTVLVRPPSIRHILQAFGGPSQDYSKVLGLRIDSLSQILHLSGVQSGSGPTTFLLFESGCQGIVSSAMIERIGTDPDVHLIVVGPTRGTNKTTAVQGMNFSEEQLAKVHYVTLAGLLNKAEIEGLIDTDGKVKTVDKLPAEIITSKPEEKTTEIEEEPMAMDGEKSNKRPAEEALEGTATKRQFSNEEVELRFIVERLKTCKADCLVVVGKENPTEITEALLPFIEYSRPVVLFSQFREPLQEAYMKIKNNRYVSALRLTEPWLRKYQVLNERSHPEVTMSSSGGYILSGITVESD